MKLRTFSAIGLVVVGLLVLAGPSAAQAQERSFAAVVKNYDAKSKRLPVAKFEPTEAKPGQTVKLIITLELPTGWHTYPTTQPDPNAADIVNQIKFPSPGDVIFVGPIQEPPNPIEKPEPKLKGNPTVRSYEGVARWEQTAVVSPEAKPGKKTVQLKRFSPQVCDAENCLITPRGIIVEAALTVADCPPVPVEEKYKAEVEKALRESRAAPTVTPDVPKAPGILAPPDGSSGASETTDTTDQRAALKEILDRLTEATPETTGTANKGFLDLILTAMFFGAVTLATPCVFPMIPITVSLFLHQSEQGRSPLRMAAVYSLTILVSLSVAALVLLKAFSDLSVNPYMNIALGCLFVFFALSLFGMFDLVLPSWLTNFTSSREQQGGTIGTIFMALTFTVISFTCVAPFLGGFGGLVSSGQFTWPELIAAALAFGGTFAAPFFLLALFPSLLRTLPKSGSWMNTVKVFMGFLEVAAAVKFFRTGELGLRSMPTLFTYDLAMGMYVALSVLCGLYLIGLFRLPHDEPQKTVGVPRFLFGFVFLSLGLYLTPALFAGGSHGEKQRPAGVVYAWVDSFLLPEPKEASGAEDELAWTGDLKQAIDDARTEAKKTGRRKFVFIDSTAVTCTNCKLNEMNVFTKKEIKQLLQGYKLVQLYTVPRVPDELYPPAVRRKLGSNLARQEDDAEANTEFIDAAFKTRQLPLYVILEPLPDGRIARVGAPYPEGKINNEKQFADFLRKPLEAAKPEPRGG